MKTSLANIVVNALVTTAIGTMFVIFQPSIVSFFNLQPRLLYLTDHISFLDKTYNRVHIYNSSRQTGDLVFKIDKKIERKDIQVQGDKGGSEIVYPGEETTVVKFASIYPNEELKVVFVTDEPEWVFTSDLSSKMFSIEPVSPFPYEQKYHENLYALIKKIFLAVMIVILLFLGLYIISSLKRLRQNPY